MLNFILSIKCVNQLVFWLLFIKSLKKAEWLAPIRIKTLSLPLSWIWFKFEYILMFDGSIILLKPISFDKFHKAVQKFIDFAILETTIIYL